MDGLVIACSMYSRIPMPQIVWSAEGMKYALAFFPIVGVVIGALMSVLFWAAETMQLGTLARCCLGTALPLLVSGGIHMDGFLDTVDARSSFEGREKKLEILKDPHAGAFAILGCGVYLLLYVAAVSQLPGRAFPAAAGIYVMTRALSGWSVVTFPKAKKDGLASTFSSGAEKQIVRAVLTVWGCGAVLFWYVTGGAVLAAVLTLAALAVFGWYYRMSLREFGGVTGDLAGYFLQITELVLVTVLAVCAR
ncbi:MAG: adenosylcobinamide-GDP ribazoletransferase [Lachnospiraceae bacterium]|nr:adenosylcobinamide-GDP ribazoletransferase [Lachnospiraceae bacterium]